MINVQVDTINFKRLEARLLLAGNRLPLKRMAVIGLRSVDRNFQEQGRPKKWKQLKSTPSRGKKKGRHKILQDKGKLRNTVDQKILGFNNFKIYSDLVYSAVHQFGYPENNITKRPFMLWQQEDADALALVVANHLAKV